jgi:hypothetical protein
MDTCTDTFNTYTKFFTCVQHNCDYLSASQLGLIGELFFRMLFDGDDATAMAHIRTRRALALLVAYNVKPFLRGRRRDAVVAGIQRVVVPAQAAVLGSHALFKVQIWRPCKIQPSTGRQPVQQKRAYQCDRTALCGNRRSTRHPSCEFGTSCCSADSPVLRVPD